MQPIECYCHNHLEGRRTFKVPPRVYFSRKTICCPDCGDSHITTKVHEGAFTLEDAKSAFGIGKVEGE